MNDTAAFTMSVNPTRAELNVILAIRRAAGALVVIDTDSMTLWQAGKPQYCNGRRRTMELPFPLDNPQA